MADTHIRKSAFLAANEKGADSKNDKNNNNKAIRAKAAKMRKSADSAAGVSDSASNSNPVAESQIGQQTQQQAEQRITTIDFASIEVRLEDGTAVSVDLTKKTGYRIRNGWLYRGLLRKIGRVKSIRIVF